MELDMEKYNEWTGQGLRGQWMTRTRKTEGKTWTTNKNKQDGEGNKDNGNDRMGNERTRAVTRVDKDRISNEDMNWKKKLKCNDKDSQG